MGTGGCLALCLSQGKLGFAEIQIRTKGFDLAYLALWLHQGLG
jgi:hypothetical protein